VLNSVPSKIFIILVGWCPKSAVKIKRNLAPFVNFPKMRPFSTKILFKHFLWMTKKKKKQSSLFQHVHTEHFVINDKKTVITFIKHHENLSITFWKTCKRRTSKMRLNFTANSFVFGCKYHENALSSFFYKPCKVKRSKMRLNFTANSFVFGCKLPENAPRTFVVNFANRERIKCVWTSQQTSLFMDT